MLKLTARQEQILNLIKDAIQNTGFPPTRAEIAAELGFRSTNAAEEHLQALARKGVIEIAPEHRAAYACWSQNYQVISQVNNWRHRNLFFSDKPATDRAGCGRIANTRIRTH
jgi:SOS-response transcriptional repressor LexA